MCGILGIFHIVGKYETVRRLATKLASKLQHRGPDASGIKLYVRKNDSEKQLPFSFNLNNICLFWNLGNRAWCMEHNMS